MSRSSLVPLEISPGIMTEETDRGAFGRYKDGDKIRFRQQLPEKLGGWALNSLGQVADGVDETLSPRRTASGTYAAGASTINLVTAVTVLDEDPVWLFDDSLVGGLGGRTVSDANAIAGAFVFDLNTVITASAGDALIIDFPEEFAGGANVTGGGTTGSDSIMISSSINTYLRAGTKVLLITASGIQVTRLSANHSAGATTLSLEDPLINNIVVATPNVFVYAAESWIISTTQSIVIRFLAGAVVAAVEVVITESLPEDADSLGVDVRPFQETTCDGDQTTTALAITPVTDFAISSVTPFPDGMVIFPVDQLVERGFLGFCRAVSDWSSLDRQKWAAIGTDLKLYLINNDFLFDITPLRTSGSLTDPFTTDITGLFDPSGGGDRTFVRVTDTTHGGQPGNFVIFSGATSVGGIDLNGEFVIQSVIDGDNYVIRATTPPTSSASGGGSVSFEYEIDIGEAGNVTVGGYGTGIYGSGSYGLGLPGAGILKELRIWSLDNFGEDLLASPNGGSLYHWDRTNGATTRAVLVSTAPATIQWMLVSPEARHVIAFGAGTGSAAAPGDPDKLLIRWSSQEDFNDWIPSSVNTAGDLRLDKGSEIVTAVESRGDIITFTDESLHALQFIGGLLVFGLRHLGQSVTIIGANAAVDVNGIVFFQGEDDYLAYDGVLRVLECEIRNTVFDDINLAQGSKTFGSVNKLFTEVWYLYPNSTSEVNNRYAKYNYKDGVWDFGTIDRTAFHDSSAFLSKPYAMQDGKLYIHETGVDDADGDGVLHPMTSFIESYDAEIEQGGQHIMHVSTMIPDFKTMVGSVDLTLTGRQYPQDSTDETIKGPFTILPTTNRQDLRMRARQISYRIESDALGDDWRMGTWRAKVRPHGRRGSGQ